MALSAGLGRTYQYTQALAPAGVQLASLSSGYLWVLADEDVGALRADLATVGVLVQPMADWRITANAYWRRSADVVMPDPRSGPLFARPEWVSGEGLARGLELSTDVRLGQWSGSGSYTLGVSTLHAAGLTFPSGADRRHILHLSSRMRLGDSWSSAAVFSSASGVPFTRIYGADIGCTEGEICAGGVVPWTGAPHAGRAPRHASLDLLLDWSGERAALRWGAFLQLRNVLARDNATVYTGGAACESLQCGPRVSPQDRLERGLPRLIILGLRVRR